MVSQAVARPHAGCTTCSPSARMRHLKSPTELPPPERRGCSASYDPRVREPLPVLLTARGPI